MRWIAVCAYGFCNLEDDVCVCARRMGCVMCCSDWHSSFPQISKCCIKEKERREKKRNPESRSTTKRYITSGATKMGSVQQASVIRCILKLGNDINSFPVLKITLKKNDDFVLYHNILPICFVSIVRQDALVTSINDSDICST